MRKSFLVVLTAVLRTGCGFPIRKSGIEVITYPQAKIYIDGKEAGTTPYHNNLLNSGEVDVKLITPESTWERKVHMEGGANTVINWEFNKDEDKSGGYILYFESTGDNEKAGMLISTTPDRAAIAIDDEIKGYSPIRLDDIGEGDKKLTVSFPGYKSIGSFVKYVNGYQLVIKANLAKEPDLVLPSVTPTPSVADLVTDIVTIKDTETGWLRVRVEPSNSASELTKVKPQERHPLLKEVDGWYLIKLGNGTSGLISSKYAEKS